MTTANHFNSDDFNRRLTVKRLENFQRQVRRFNWNGICDRASSIYSPEQIRLICDRISDIPTIQLAALDATADRLAQELDSAVCQKCGTNYKLKDKFGEYRSGFCKECLLEIEEL